MWWSRRAGRDVKDPMNTMPIAWYASPAANPAICVRLRRHSSGRYKPVNGSLAAATKSTTAAAMRRPRPEP